MAEWKFSIMAGEIESSEPEGKKTGKAIDIQGIDIQGIDASKKVTPISVEELGVKKQGEQVETDAAANPKDK